jgi:hypothetical protein
MGRRIRDLTGQRFGALVAVRLAGRRAGKTVWACRCDCGAEVEAPLWALRDGWRTSCGCLVGRPPGGRGADLTGRRFGRWRVVSAAGHRPRGVTLWLCRCACGAERVLSATDLHDKRGLTCPCRPGTGRRGRPRVLAPSPRDREIVAARAGGEKLEEIAARYGLSRQRVQQIVRAERLRRARRGDETPELHAPAGRTHGRGCRLRPRWASGAGPGPRPPVTGRG